MAKLKHLWQDSPAVRAGVIVALSILLIIGLTSVANLFTIYEIRMSTSARGLELELTPRTAPNDSLQNPQRPVLPPLFPYEDEVGVWNDDFPAMPTAVLGDGTTLELRPLPLPDIDGNSPRLSFQEIFQEKSDSVVLVEVQLRMGRGSGTGVIMTENGYIITSAHVVEDARAVHVTLQDGTRFEAAIVGMDANTDIAVLKIDATDLSPAEFGDSDLLQVGEEVAVIGNPLGHLHSMSNGIVSALDRDVVYDGITMRLIQTNAAINEGNSGGPLFNLYGQVVGITNMKLVGHFNSIEGMGFAVPTALLKPVVDSIIEHGRVVGRPALGVIVRSVDELDAIIEGVEPGVYIQRVLEDTDAYAQGLQEDDRIVSANGAEIISSFDLREQILSFTAGDTITLVIERDGEEIELQVRLMDADLLEF